MTTRTRWGILATGQIAGAMAEALRTVPDAELVAVASRTQAKAEAFAQKWQIQRSYASYEALANDPEVDIVYIATPHSHHYENMLLCLHAGKHVLCEKAFTINAAQAAACIAVAQRKGLFLMEAMWMAFIPAMVQLRSWLQDGILGDIRYVQADFGLNVPFSPKHRLYNPELGGGALLDLGIYPLSFAAMVLGMPQDMYSHAVVGSTGVDELDSLTLVYKNGAFAHLTCALIAYKPREAWIMGSMGYIKVHDIFFRPTTLTIGLHDREPEVYHIPYRGNGYVHEIEEVHRCLQTGKLESDILPLATTMALMQIMDQLRATWGVVYPQEQ